MIFFKVWFNDFQGKKSREIRNVKKLVFGASVL